ncbi:MAG: exodeoxyribonuclease V subunit alpha [Betaproteobacteria bacterium]
MTNGDHDIDRPERVLAQAFAERVARWSRERGADAPSSGAARDAAYAASMAVSAGHACVRVGDIAHSDDDPARFRACLAASRVVGAPDGIPSTPLVQDAAGRLYLARYFDYEQRLGRAIARRVAAPLREVAPAAQQTLAALFGEARATGQALAAALALLRPLTVVSGGPGTGKTTTVVRLLACLVAADPACRIALAAPTGKAAARLQDALAAFASNLPPALAGRLPATVSTVHRLLGVYADGHRLRHDATHPLAVDVVVVDEASMLDLALATRLFEAVPDSARLLLVGDKDQLAAVEAGAVFAELTAGATFSARGTAALAALTGATPEEIRAAGHPAPGALPDSVVWLAENFRFAQDSSIGRLAAAVNAGDGAAAVAALRAGGTSNVRWIDDGARVPAAATLAAIAEGYAELLAALAATPPDIARCFAALARFRVLCAERGGPRGADGINATMASRVREASGAAGADADGVDRSAWYAGRVVMVRANDYVQGLFNGDVGLSLHDGDAALRVWFAAADGGFRAIAPARLPAHETAFASTVHKAQGSEFDDVVLVLPAGASRVVTRELVYTAITRARRRVTLAAGAATLEAAVATPTRRDSGLSDRIAEALSPSG